MTKLKSVNFIQVSIQFYFNFTILYSGFRSDVKPFFGVLLLRFGHESGCCFAVADASQSSRSLCLACSLATKRKSQFCKFYSRVSKVTLSPFSGFLGYVLGTKLGCVLPLRMRHKAMQLLLGRLAGHKTEKSRLYSFRSDVRPLFGVLLVGFGHEIGCSFAVANASQNHAACAGKLDGHKTEKSSSINFFTVGFQK